MGEGEGIIYGMTLRCGEERKMEEKMVIISE